ncbi:uncharacterized protein LOC117171348 [Belonocnema kinseyi]|uniref:uncharacterized protein LOC117171348 n=1 Tax=Belonocnema kinseyi TaxID=2817044 RepID=UPI00143DAF9D|nr:uncharacterized protein LOC117171348 [Belonocnema kinseyi]
MSSIFYCSIFGAYLLIVAFDYYIGSSLKYIIINIVRRITVPNYDVAIFAPPYGTAEMTLTAFWVIFTLLSFFIQLKSCCERRNNLDEMTIPLATRDETGAIHYTPWANIFREHRQLRKSLRDSDRASSRCCNIL